jgi:hypothetical protein
VTKAMLEPDEARLAERAHGRPPLVVGTCCVIWALGLIYLVVGLFTGDWLPGGVMTAWQMALHLSVTGMVAVLQVASIGLWNLKRWGVILYGIGIPLGFIGNAGLFFSVDHPWERFVFWLIFLAAHFNLTWIFWKAAGKKGQGK